LLVAWTYSFSLFPLLGKDAIGRVL